MSPPNAEPQNAAKLTLTKLLLKSVVKRKYLFLREKTFKPCSFFFNVKIHPVLIKITAAAEC